MSDGELQCEVNNAVLVLQRFYRRSNARSGAATKRSMRHEEATRIRESEAAVVVQSAYRCRIASRKRCLQSHATQTLLLQRLGRALFSRISLQTLSNTHPYLLSLRLLFRTTPLAGLPLTGLALCSSSSPESKDLIAILQSESELHSHSGYKGLLTLAEAVMGVGEIAAPLPISPQMEEREENTWSGVDEEVPEIENVSPKGDWIDPFSMTLILDNDLGIIEPGADFSRSGGMDAIMRSQCRASPLLALQALQTSHKKVESRRWAKELCDPLRHPMLYTLFCDPDEVQGLRWLQNASDIPLPFINFLVDTNSDGQSEKGGNVFGRGQPRLNFEASDMQFAESIILPRTLCINEVAKEAEEEVVNPIFEEPVIEVCCDPSEGVSGAAEGRENTHSDAIDHLLATCDSGVHEGLDLLATACFADFKLNRVKEAQEFAEGLAHLFADEGFDIESDHDIVAESDQADINAKAEEVEEPLQNPIIVMEPQTEEAVKDHLGVASNAMGQSPHSDAIDQLLASCGYDAHEGLDLLATACFADFKLNRVVSRVHDEAGKPTKRLDLLGMLVLSSSRGECRGIDLLAESRRIGGVELLLLAGCSAECHPGLDLLKAIVSPETRKKLGSHGMDLLAVSAPPTPGASLIVASTARSWRGLEMLDASRSQERNTWGMPSPSPGLDLLGFSVLSTSAAKPQNSMQAHTAASQHDFTLDPAAPQKTKPQNGMQGHAAQANTLNSLLNGTEPQNSMQVHMATVHDPAALSVGGGVGPCPVQVLSSLCEGEALRALACVAGSAGRYTTALQLLAAEAPIGHLPALTMLRSMPAHRTPTPDITCDAASLTSSGSGVLYRNESSSADSLFSIVSANLEAPAATVATHTLISVALGYHTRRHLFAEHSKRRLRSVLSGYAARRHLGRLVVEHAVLRIQGFSRVVTARRAVLDKTEARDLFIRQGFRENAAVQIQRTVRASLCRRRINRLQAEQEAEAKAELETCAARILQGFAAIVFAKNLLAHRRAALLLEQQEYIAATHIQAFTRTALAKQHMTSATQLISKVFRGALCRSRLHLTSNVLTIQSCGRALFSRCGTAMHAGFVKNVITLQSFAKYVISRNIVAAKREKVLRRRRRRAAVRCLQRVGRGLAQRVGMTTQGGTVAKRPHPPPAVAIQYPARRRSILDPINVSRALFPSPQKQPHAPPRASLAEASARHRGAVSPSPYTAVPHPPPVRKPRARPQGTTGIKVMQLVDDWRHMEDRHRKLTAPQKGRAYQEARNVIKEEGGGGGGGGGGPYAAKLEGVHGRASSPVRKPVRRHGFLPPLVS